VYELIIRGGTVVGQGIMDVAVREGKIAAVEPKIAESATTEINAAGLHIFPGLIDPHVHFNEPGRTEWEGLETGSRALAAGGVTTFFDMPLNSSPPVTTVEAYDAKLALTQEKSIVNGYLWGGLIPSNLDQLEALDQRGVIGFKAFMSNSGIEEFPAVDDYTLYEGMRIVENLRGIIAVHAESDNLTTRWTQDAVARGEKRAKGYLRTRPAVAEVEAIQRAILFSKETGCDLYIVHVSTAEGVDLVRKARNEGVGVSCETCPHYLLLTEDDVVRLGAVAKCAPPIRSDEEREKLWERLLTGDIHFIASDHSPSSPDLKQGDDFFKIWGGISGCQSTLSLLLTEGYHKRGMTLEQIAHLTSRSTAQRFGLTRKGRLEAGADADIAIVDVDARYTLRAEDLHYRHKISPYIGMDLRGKVTCTIVGGKIVYQNGGFPNG
jgi:allantoinase